MIQKNPVETQNEARTNPNKRQSALNSDCKDSYLDASCTGLGRREENASSDWAQMEVTRFEDWIRGNFFFSPRDFTEFLRHSWGRSAFWTQRKSHAWGGAEACVQFLLMFLWYWDWSNKIPWKMFIFIIPQGKNCPNMEFISYFDWLSHNWCDTGCI